jgi:hypothetical protein
MAMRVPGLFDNYCSCPDFAVHTLGTCNHLEPLLGYAGAAASRSIMAAQIVITCDLFPST